MENKILQNLTPNFQLDPSRLENKDIASIKKLAKDTRGYYGSAPIGRDIFSFIGEKEGIELLKYDFSSDKLDAMIYKNPSSIKTYILVNQNKTLFNQIFAVAHEYYHFINDLQDSNGDFVCDFSSTNLREISANRFAAEFLLPSEAISQAILDININDNKFNESSYLKLILKLSYRFCVPLNVVFSRLMDEKVIKKTKKLENILSNTEKIDALLEETELFSELLSTRNDYILDSSIQLVKRLYDDTIITLNEYITLLKNLEYPKNLMDLVLSDNEEDDDDSDSNDNYKKED